MTLRVSGKNMDIGSALRGQIEVRVNAAVEKYFGGNASGHVTLTRDGGGYRTDCGLHLDSGITLEASGNAHDPVVSFDQAADRMEKRLRRYNARLKSRQAANDAWASPVLNGGAGADDGDFVSATVFAEPGDEADHEDFHPVVVAEMTKTLPLLPVSSAVSQLDITGAPILLFRHAGTSRLNIVYRRNDGTIGWIDPPASERA
ncbi:ribosome hibernation-promoting factor, HPF/YfiA family [Camelimonas sp. ID_303_24]